MKNIQTLNQLKKVDMSIHLWEVENGTWNPTCASCSAFNTLFSASASRSPIHSSIFLLSRPVKKQRVMVGEPFEGH